MVLVRSASSVGLQLHQPGDRAMRCTSHCAPRRSHSRMGSTHRKVQCAAWCWQDSVCRSFAIRSTASEGAGACLLCDANAFDADDAQAGGRDWYGPPQGPALAGEDAVSTDYTVGSGSDHHATVPGGDYSATVATLDECKAACNRVVHTRCAGFAGTATSIIALTQPAR